MVDAHPYVAFFIPLFGRSLYVGKSAVFTSRRQEESGNLKFLLRLFILYKCLVYQSIHISAWSPILQLHHETRPKSVRGTRMHSFVSIKRSSTTLWASEPSTENINGEDARDARKIGSERGNEGSHWKSTYDLGAGKNPPVGTHATNNTSSTDESIDASALGSLMGNDVTKLRWTFPKPKKDTKQLGNSQTSSLPMNDRERPRRVRKMVAKSQESSVLRGAIWHEEHYSSNAQADSANKKSYYEKSSTEQGADPAGGIDVNAIDPFPRPKFFYPNIDLSIPDSIYDPENGIDVVWDLMRWEAYQEAQREPLLVSFLYSSILNHDSLESSLAFLLANKLSGIMISTQINSLIMEALNNDPSIGRAIRADIMAVRDRDPACTCLPDVFLYFKGFHALQTYRVAHAIWKADKQVLAHYLQSQMSQTFQIDIHPNATLGSGIMLGKEEVLLRRFCFSGMVHMSGSTNNVSQTTGQEL